MEKTIYDLKLHESEDRTYLSIQRVPGGWIYNYKDPQGYVFVPYDDEFKVYHCTKESCGEFGKPHKHIKTEHVYD